VQPVLRKYQLDAKKAVRDLFVGGKRSPLLVMPTGAGKTIWFADVVAGSQRLGKRVLVLAHRQELLAQIGNALKLYGCKHGFVTAKRKHDHLTNSVLIASVQTLVNRMDKIKWTPDLIIMDEAHHATAGTWRKILEFYQGARTIGVTATPERLDGKGLGVEAGGCFDSMTLGPSVSQLVALNYLTPNRIWASSKKLDLSGVKKRGGDYAKGDLEEAVDKPAITGDAIAHYKEHASGQRAIAFCVTVAHAEHTATAFREAGISAESLDGKLSDIERQARLARLRSGETLVITSCDLISEGFDLPAATAAILLRPTASLSLYLQQVGRVLRPMPGKSHALILDHVGNSLVHGLPEQDREWTLEGRDKAARKKTEAGLQAKQCANCFAVFKPMPACPMCGEPVKIGEREIVTEDGELREMTDQDRAAIKRAIKREEAEAVTLEDLEKLAHRRGYKPGWAAHRHAARQGRKSRWGR